MLTTYFGGLGDNLDTAARAAGGRPASRSRARARPARGGARRRRRDGLVLSLGVIDGRNVWRANLPAILDRLEPVVAQRAARTISSRAVLLAAACPGRPRDRDALDAGAARPGWPSRCRRWASSPTLGRALDAGAAAAAEALAASAAAAEHAQASAKIHDSRVSARARPSPPRWPGAAALRRAATGPAGAVCVCRVSHHDDRLLPADGGGPQGARRAMQRARSAMPTTRPSCDEEIEHGRPLPGGASGSTCWCTASSSATTWWSTSASSSRACVHRQRLGAELRLALRQAADHLRRRRRARDPMTVALVALRPVADDAADEGHAHRAGDDAAMVVRARRPAAVATLPARSRWRCATRSRTWRRPASASSRSTSRRFARGCRCADATGRATSTGRSSAFRSCSSGVRGRDADPHAHVLLRVQRHHRLDRARWTPT